MVGMKRRTAASVPLWLALSALPHTALAQAVDTATLEARMAELEAEMQQMRGLLQQYQQRDAKAAENTPAVAVATPPAQESTPILPGAMPGTRFTAGGFIKLDAMTTRTSDGAIADGSAGRLFYFPAATPVAADGNGKSASYTDVHAQFSRFWLGADTVTERGDTLKAYIEADMYGGGNNAFAGNEVITNTYALTLRQAYVSWNHWLAGWPDLVQLPGCSGTAGHGGLHRSVRGHHLQPSGAASLHARPVVVLVGESANDGGDLSGQQHPPQQWR